MAFSYESKGGIAVARILSDHPEDHARLVYLHNNYAPSIDDDYYNTGADADDNSVAGNDTGPYHYDRGADQLHYFDEKHGSGTASNGTAEPVAPSQSGVQPYFPPPRRETEPWRRPVTKPASATHAGHTAFTTLEQPDPDARASTSGSGSGSGSGPSLPTGTTVLDPASGEWKLPAAATRSSSAPAQGTGPASGGTSAPLMRGGAFDEFGREIDDSAQGTPAEASGGHGGTGHPIAGHGARTGSAKRRRSIRFDPEEPMDEQGARVAPRKKQRTEHTAGRSRLSLDDDSAGDRKGENELAANTFANATMGARIYPLPDKPPDQLSAAEFAKWADSLTDEQYAAFKADMGESESGSDSDETETDSETDSVASADDAPPSLPPPLPPPPNAQAPAPWLAPVRPIPMPPPASKKRRSQRIYDEYDEEERPPKRSRPMPPPIVTNPNGRGHPPPSSAYDQLGPDYFQRGERSHRSAMSLNQFQAQLQQHARGRPMQYEGPKAATMKRVADEAIQDAERRTMGKEIELFGGDVFRLIPSWPKRECIFIVGQQGAGKSWVTGRYIREWKKQHPDGKVVVFSQVANDDELDRCGITRVMIDDGLIDNPYQVKELANALVVFDDIDAIRDKKIKKAVTDLCDELQVIGRHENTWVIRTSHLFRNWGATKASLAESNKTIFFPQLGSSYGIKNWLKTHVGLDPKKIDRMFKIRSRWAVLDQHAPNWLLSEHLLYML